MNTPTRVFISYSHDSQEHVDAILALADCLRQEGIDARLDQYEAAPIEGWPRWMLNQIEKAHFVLVVCTEVYYRRFRGKEQRHKGLGANWEASIITQELYEGALNNAKFIPIVLNDEDKNYVPEPLRAFTLYDLAHHEGYENLYRRLTNQPKIPIPQLGTLRSLPPQSRQQVFQPQDKYTGTQITPNRMGIVVPDSSDSPTWISKRLLDAFLSYGRKHKGAFVVSIIFILPFAFVLEGVFRPLWLSIKTRNQPWIHKFVVTGAPVLVIDISLSSMTTLPGWLSALVFVLHIPFLVCLFRYYTSRVSLDIKPKAT